MRTFYILSDLPQKTQVEVARILAIPSAQRLTSENAFITALGNTITNQIYTVDENGLIMSASCLGTPPDDVVGFKKGALIVQTDAGSSTKGLFENIEDDASATWDLLASAQTTDIDDGAVTMAKLADMANNTIIGRVAGTTGVPKALSASELKALITPIATADLAAHAVTGAKVATNLVISFSGVGVNASVTPANATVTGVKSGDILLMAYDVTTPADVTADFATTANGTNTISQLTTNLSAKTIRFLFLSQQA